MEGKVTISHRQTRTFKYLQSSIPVIWIILEIVTGNTTGVIVLLAFLILFSLINVFVVEASVDKDAIYVRQRTKEIKFSLDQIDKIAEVKGGLTSFSILTEKGK